MGVSVCMRIRFCIFSKSIGFCALSALSLALVFHFPASAQTRSAYEWNGFYVGAHSGYGWGHDASQSGPIGGAVNSSSTRTPQGLFGGLQAGYNFLPISKILLGIEIDASAAHIQGDSLAGNGFSALQTRLNWFGTVRGRLGYASGQFLIYGTGGLAWAAVEEFRTQLVGTTGAATPGTVEKASYTNYGWTVGGGTEIGIARRWSVKAEYLYFDLGSKLFTRSISQVFAEHSDTVHVARIGVNYKF